MSSEQTDTRTRILATALQLLEKEKGREMRMVDIAKAAGVSRQAVYLHFGSRAELLVATTLYVEEVLDLDGRLERWEAVTNGLDRLDEWVKVWGEFLPGIHGVAKALLAARETDEAAAAAWDDRMAALRRGCRTTLRALERDGLLAPEWSLETAIDLLWSLLSVRNWEHLTIDCGWSSHEFIDRMQSLARSTFVRE